jgi:hypothetical protein
MHIRPYREGVDGWAALIEGDYVAFDKGIHSFYILKPSDREHAREERWTFVPENTSLDEAFAELPTFETAEAAIAYARMVNLKGFV